MSKIVLEISETAKYHTTFYTSLGDFFAKIRSVVLQLLVREVLTSCLPLSKCANKGADGVPSLLGKWIGSIAENARIGCIASVLTVSEIIVLNNYNSI